ncbi:MAG: hypothetical protein WAN87_04315 [Thermoplasmata archaeon]
MSVGITLTGVGALLFFLASLEPCFPGAQCLGITQGNVLGVVGIVLFLAGVPTAVVGWRRDWPPRISLSEGTTKKAEGFQPVMYPRYDPEESGYAPTIFGQR